MSAELTASWGIAALVVLSTTAMYAVFLVLVRLIGQRSIAQLSSIDLGCVVMTGAVMGRTALLVSPTLARGVVALVTLFSVRGVLWWLHRNPIARRAVTPQPVLLMSRNQMLSENMRRAHVTVDDLRQELRSAGVRRRDEVESIILERSGNISVIRCSAPAEPWLLDDVGR